MIIIARGDGPKILVIAAVGILRREFHRDYRRDCAPARRGPAFFRRYFKTNIVIVNSRNPRTHGE
jgi:hypothetical protein